MVLETYEADTPWTVRRTNEKVFRMVGERTLLTTVRRRQLRYVGHLMREKDRVEMELFRMFDE